MKISKIVLATLAVAAMSLSAVKADDLVLVPNGHGQYSMIYRAQEKPTVALFVHGRGIGNTQSSRARTTTITSKDNGHGQGIVLRRTE